MILQYTMYCIPSRTIALYRSSLLAGLCCLATVGCSQTTPRAAAAGGDVIGRNDSAVKLFQQGQEAARNGDTLRAEQYLSLALEAGFDQRRILPLMLKVCLQSSRLRSALDHAEPYLLQHPEDRTLRYLVATIYSSLGQIDEARLNLEELLRSDAKNADAHYLLGILEVKSAPGDAADHLHAYLSLAPEGIRSAEVKSRLIELEVRAANALREVEPARRSSNSVDKHSSGALQPLNDGVRDWAIGEPDVTNSSWKTAQP